MAALLDVHALHGIAINLVKCDGYQSFNSVINDVLTNYQSFQSSNYGQELVTVINKFLATPEHRVRGLNLLHHVLDQCSTEVFNENAASWTKQLLHMLQNYDCGIAHELSCYLLAEIFTYAVSFPEISREISSIIVQLVTAIIQSKQHWEYAALVCLRSCLENFSGSSGNSKSKIETFLISHLARKDDTYWDIASDCFALLPGCGGGGHLGVKHSESWSLLCSKVMNTLNNLCCSIYRTTEDKNQEENELVIAQLLVAETNEEPEYLLSLANHFCVASLCLQKLFKRKTVYNIHVPIDKVVKLICQCLSVDGVTLLERPTSKNLLLAGILVDLHREVLLILKCLVNICGRDIIVHSVTINQLILQTLRWTVTDSLKLSLGSEKPLSSLRVCAYHVLSDWLAVAGNSTLIDSVADNFVSFILSDIKPEIDSLKLNSSIATNYMELKSVGVNKRRKKSNVEPTGNLAGLTKINLYANFNLCHAGLKSLQMLVMMSGMILKPKCMLAVEAFVIEELISIQNNSSSISFYANATNRAELYNLLKQCVLVSHPEHAPAISCALRLFSFGAIHDHSILVKTSCQESLAMCTAIIHPRIPIGANFASKSIIPECSKFNYSVFRKQTLNLKPECLIAMDTDVVGKEDVATSPGPETVIHNVNMPNDHSLVIKDAIDISRNSHENPQSFDHQNMGRFALKISEIPFKESKTKGDGQYSVDYKRIFGTNEPAYNSPKVSCDNWAIKSNDTLAVDLAVETQISSDGSCEVDLNKMLQTFVDAGPETD